MSIKKVVSLILVIAVLAIANAAMAADAIKIGVVTPDADHGFTGESVAHARAELEKQAAERGFEFKFEVGGEAQKQIDAIDTILSWGPDVILLWPLEGEQLKNAALKITDAGVGLIVYDRLIDGFKPANDAWAEMMGDNVAIGQMMGAYLLDFYNEQLTAGETITYLRFIGDSSTVSKQRSGGMDESIEKAGKTASFVQVQADFQTDWSNAKAQEQMENWLNTADKAAIADLDLIVTHDDEVVDGIVIALENYAAANSGVLNIKLITSVGGRRETLGTFFAEDGTPKPVAGGMALDTYYFSPSYIRDAVKCAVAMAYGEQYEGKDIAGGYQFLIPSLQIDKDSVQEYRGSQVFADRYSLK